MIKRIIVKGYRQFIDFALVPNPGMNIVVGDNEAGKSTLLEAIALALTCHSNGHWAQDELDPYWFNQTLVREYFNSLAGPNPLPPPEILIELYLTLDDDAVQEFLGVHNSRQEKVPGIRLHIGPDPEYAEEFADYMADEERPSILPTEWYRVDWRMFSDDRLVRRPRQLGASVIDSRTIRSTTGVDYHTRQMLDDFISPKERAAVAVAHRKARHSISTETLQGVNARIVDQSKTLHDRPIGLHMDQSANASWERAIVPQVADVPFTLAGQGQQAAIKVALAMNRSADATAYALIEEPESHLSHTSLTKLVRRIEALAGDRQVFVATHSSFVLNRLGLDKLFLLNAGAVARFDSLPQDTVRYFKRLSGYDTLRLVLADRVVLVEGPSDEMVFERAFRDSHDGHSPAELGIDVVSMAGVSLKRGLQLCAALGRRAAAIRDNDGQDPDHWKEPLKEWLQDEVREVFIGDKQLGRTLEPQFVAANDEAVVRDFFAIPDADDASDWLRGRKTEWALMIDEVPEHSFVFPKYVLDSIKFIS